MSDRESILHGVIYMWTHRRRDQICVTTGRGDCRRVVGRYKFPVMDKYWDAMHTVLTIVSTAAWLFRE